MAAFLLWNINGKQLDGLVQSLVRLHNIDVVLLVEFNPQKSQSQLSTMLLTDGLSQRGNPGRFGVFGRSSHGLNLVPSTLGDHAQMWEWTSPSNQSGLLTLVHGLDRRYNDDSTRRVFFRRIA